MILHWRRESLVLETVEHVLIVMRNVITEGQTSPGNTLRKVTEGVLVMSSSLAPNSNHVATAWKVLEFECFDLFSKRNEPGGTHDLAHLQRRQEFDLISRNI